MPALLAACPSFEPVWRDIVADWSATEERGPYTDLGFFAHHLVSLLERYETAEFATVFATLERLFRDGDDGIRYLLKVGLLEDLGNIASNQRDWSFAERFRDWFGPAATVAWDELHEEWGGTSLRDTPTR
jgi:hypothetical protein